MQSSEEVKLQIVSLPISLPDYQTSLIHGEMLCSRRNSLWANAALVVAVQPSDWSHLESEHGALAGVALQIQAERYASVTCE